MPLVLLVVFLVLALLLRALLLPVILIATVVLSFLAALGVGAFFFEFVFDFPGSDPSLPLWAFVFLVALGIDYNIFLMARVREEALRHGTRPGMVRGLAVTGGVITSAGIVLAGTFSVLASLPLVFLTEIGFMIAFGVLLDTFLVRSVLVPGAGLRHRPEGLVAIDALGIDGAAPAPRSRAGDHRLSNCGSAPSARRRRDRLSPAPRRGAVSPPDALGTFSAMELSLLLIIIGIVLAILVHYALGIILILIGLVLLILPRLRGGTRRA